VQWVARMKGSTAWLFAVLVCCCGAGRTAGAPERVQRQLGKKKIGSLTVKWKPAHRPGWGGGLTLIQFTPDGLERRCL